MPIQTVCPGCGKALGVPDHALGKQVRCAACQLVFVAEQPAGELAVVDEAQPADAQAAPIAETPLRPAPAAETPVEPLVLPSDSAATRRREAARKQSSGAMALVIVLLAALVGVPLVLGCFCGVGWWFIRAGREEKQIAAQMDQVLKKVDRPKEDKQPPPVPDLWGRPGDKKPPDFEKNPQIFEERFPPFVPGDPRADGPIVPPVNERPIVAKTGKLPPLPAPLPIKPAPLTSDVVTKPLAGAIQNVVLGGGGRFLILHLPKLRQLAVFDVNEAKVVKYLPVAADNAMIAAGMTKLILAFPDTKIVQRWNLLTFERELTATLPINHGIAGIGMGYGSDGPLLIQTVREPVSGDDLFLDIRTMKLIDLEAKVVTGHVHRGANAHIRGSLDGRAFGAASGGGHPYLLTIESGGAVIRGTDGGMRAVPGPDGKNAFGMGVYNGEMKPIGGMPVDNSMWCVPALQGPFYLAIPAGTFHPGIPGQRKAGGVELRIVGDNRPILTLAGIDNATRDVFALNREGLAIDQRYHFIPAAHLLITIPSTADRLVLHKLNLDDALDKSGIDYLFVASTPPPYAVLGQEYTYPVRAKSKKGGLKFRVDAGPDGMKVDPNGVVRWKVPADHAKGATDVIMTISDTAGQEIFHTFKLTVVGELPREAKPPAPAAENKEPAPPIKEREPEPVVKVPVPPAADALTIRAPKLDATPLTCKLPATLDQLVIGGGGRFLLINLPSQRRIALFDANEAKIVHYFPVAGDNVRYTAGLEKLVMVFPDTRVIQRWNLLTRQRELTATLGGNGTIANVLMGSASHGPVIVALAGQFGAGGNLLVDLATLKSRGAAQQGNIGGRSLSEFACISADGSVVACWGGGSPSGLQIYHVTPTGLKSYYEHISPGHLMPSPDGKIIYTSRGMFTNEAKPIGVNTKARDGIGPWCIPAACGDYYLSVNLNNFPGQAKPRALSVHLQGEERTLITLSDIELPKGINAWGREKFGDYQRIMFIPDAKMIVTVADTNDRLIVHRFDIDEALDKAGIDFLYATSRAPARAVRGTDYAYAITTRSKKGGVTYKLESGPDGMRISKAGIIVWHVPPDQPLGEANVIVTIADRSGQEIFHTFRVAVEDKR